MSPDRCGYVGVPVGPVEKCSACAEWELYNKAFPETPKLFCSICGRRLPVERV